MPHTMTPFVKKWNASTQPRKQRLYRYNAPLHTRQAFMRVHLSKELRKKYHQRALLVRKGDTVKVSRGQFSRKEGKVDRVDMRRERVFIYGVELLKKDGTKVAVSVHPSNLVLTDVDLSDVRRRESVESFVDNEKNTKQNTPKMTIKNSAKK